MQPPTTSIALLLALLVTLAACGGDGDDATTAVSPDDQTAAAGDGPDDAGTDGDPASPASEEPADDGAAATGSSGDLQVVWPLPPGNFEAFLPYQLIDDEFQYSEFAAFQTMEVSVDDVLDHYRQYFPTIGFEVNELELGESIALNLTNPEDPAWTGVVQAGETSDGWVTVSQNYSDPKDS